MLNAAAIIMDIIFLGIFQPVGHKIYEGEFMQKYRTPKNCYGHLFSSEEVWLYRQFSRSDNIQHVQPSFDYCLEGK